MSFGSWNGEKPLLEEKLTCPQPARWRSDLCSFAAGGACRSLGRRRTEEPRLVSKKLHEGVHASFHKRTSRESFTPVRCRPLKKSSWSSTGIVDCVRLPWVSSRYDSEKRRAHVGFEKGHDVLEFHREVDVDREGGAVFGRDCEMHHYG